MDNPFEDETATYHVLVNAEHQHSLWPGAAEVPAGWTSVYGPADRGSCLEYVRVNWTDMRPKSLVDRMTATSTATGR